MGKDKKNKIEEELVYFELSSLSKKEQKIIEVFDYLCKTFDNGKGQKNCSTGRNGTYSAREKVLSLKTS